MEDDKLQLQRGGERAAQSSNRRTTFYADGLWNAAVGTWIIRMLYALQGRVVAQRKLAKRIVWTGRIIYEYIQVSFVSLKRHERCVIS
ncbi:MAG: hypothetical protein NVS2B7_16430 [Herpetosiphon sp.]